MLKISKLLLPDPKERVWYYLCSQMNTARYFKDDSLLQWYEDALEFYSQSIDK